MVKQDELPSVVFPDWYDELAQFEHSCKGYLDGVLVKTVDGKEYELSFIDPVRLQQSLNDNITAGLNYFTERNLIVVRKVTKEEILDAVKAIFKEGIWKYTFLTKHDS